MAADESSSLFSFFFYVMVVYPAANWLLKPGRFPKGKAILYTAGMLVAIAAVKTGLEVAERGPNYYSLLNVSRGSNSLDVKRAYKKMSLEVHPDKNPRATAADDFAKLKEVYDVLLDPERRDVYNRFGEDGVKSNKHVDEYRMLLEIAVFYVAWGVMAFLLTLGKASAAARQWIFTGQIAMFVVEVLLMLHELQLPDWFLPQTTEHELIVLMHSLFPAYLNGCRCIGNVLYVDLEEQTKQLLLALHEQNKNLIEALGNLHRAILDKVDSSAKDRRPAASTTPAQPKVSVTEKLRELEQTLKGGPLLGQPQGPQLTPANFLMPQNQRQSNLGLYVMLAVYIGAYYLFQGTS
mmetsp:Transcript_12415/g.40580  ORF Transcript_12415/g.40580 Transcript_12415/m.40580 type:complete len:350 (-) Transcript_12415:350-1399(-)